MSKSYWGKPPLDLKGNKPASLGDGGKPEAHRASNWIVAIDAWDYCDPTILTEMLMRHPIPFELQPVIADIVSGKRKPNKKAAVKLKIPAGHRMIVAGIYAELKEGVVDAILDRRGIPDYHEVAEKKGMEVSDLRKQHQENGRAFKVGWADAAGVSVETLENLYLELREKLKNYPKI